MQKYIWEEQAIKYTVAKANAILNELSTNKPSLTEKFDAIIAGLSDIALLGVLPNDQWEHNEKALDLIYAYNPDTLTWEKIDFLIMGLLSGVMGVYQDNDVSKFANLLFNVYRDTANYMRVPHTYSGSRYLLFNNGIYDCKTQSLIPIEQKISNRKPTQFSESIPTVDLNETELEIDGENVMLPFVGFTEKHRHHFDLDLNIENPTYASNMKGILWSPKEWLERTVNYDEQAKKFVLSILGMMLVPNHSFNSFIEINGLSSGGKTTLINIISSIYNSKNVLTGFTLDDLNDSFPFRGNVNTDTVLVHISETNAARLKSSGIAIINSFANVSMQMKQLGSQSVNLAPPPLLVLEGKGWVLFDNTKTGIARRLLPIDITEAKTANYRNQRYGKKIFERKKVLQWLAKEALKAFSELTQGSDSFAWNIDDLSTLPPIVRKWHFNAINAGDKLMNQYVQRIIPALFNGYISTDLLYELYQKSAQLDGATTSQVRQSNSFKDAVIASLNTDYQLTPIRELASFSGEQLALDISKISDVLPLPISLQNYNNSNFARYKRPNWYKIERIAEK